MGDFNYASNSDKSKEATPPKQKIISGTVTARPETKAGKLASIFIAEDVSNVRDYIWDAVVVPMCKRGLVELVNTGTGLISSAFNMMVYGTPGNKNARYNSFNGKRDYDRCYGPKATNAESRPTDGSRRYRKDFIVNTREDAERVYMQLLADIEAHGEARLTDYYRYVGENVDDDWQMSSLGWTDLSSAYIEPYRDGRWVICMPKIRQLRG